MSANPRLTEWRGRRAWLVGASSGIGRATASALHAVGATVYVSGRNASALADFASNRTNAFALPLDVSSREQVAAAAHSVLQEGPVDLVVYCAGHYSACGVGDFDLEEMLKHQRVNYVGALHVLDAVLPPLLKQRGGHLSLVGSVAGYRGLPRSLGYGPTKAALINLAESLHLELRPQGVGVSVVNPGFVDTPLTAGNEFSMPALITAEEAAREMLQGWARGRFEIHFPRRFTWPMKLLALLPFPAYQALVRRGTGL